MADVETQGVVRVAVCAMALALYGCSSARVELGGHYIANEFDDPYYEDDEIRGGGGTIGLRLNRFVSLSGSYNRLTGFADVIGAPSLEIETWANLYSIDVRGYPLAVSELPVQPFVIAGLTIVDGEFETSFVVPGFGRIDDTYSDNAMRVGLGVDIEFTEHLFVRGQYSRVEWMDDLDGQDADFWEIGAGLSFEIDRSRSSDRVDTSDER